MSGTTPAPAGPGTPSAELAGLQVPDVLLQRPKTLPADVSVARARGEFGDDHVHMLLLVGPDERLAGTLVREDLDGAVDGPALEYATLEERTIDISLSAEAARQVLMAAGQRRRAAVDDEGRLVGLLCLKRRRTGFCSDVDVASRAAEFGTRPCAPDEAQNTGPSG